MDKTRLLELLNKQEEETLNDQERNELDEWYNSLSYNSKAIDGDEENLKASMLLQFRQRTGKASISLQVPAGRRRLLKIAAVGAGLLLTGAAFFLVFRKKTAITPPVIVKAADNKIKDVAPGTNRATLRLGDGSTIDLETSSPGLVTRQGNVQVVKTPDGALGYHPVVNEQVSVMYNTLFTPRGGEYQLMLPDGSKVWLNASSSLRYPTSFTGTVRKVEVSGEAYFEVTKNAAMPFIVSVNGTQEVQVLGTHFNINAYNEEGPEKTTLLEGTVRVVEKNYSVILKPGQQSALSENGFRVEEADTEQAVAWKTGFFEFDNSSLQTIMRGISRWYDVDIVYKGKPASSVVFGGRISRHLPLSNVLDMLKAYGVHASINGKEIIIDE